MKNDRLILNAICGRLLALGSKLKSLGFLMVNQNGISEGNADEMNCGIGEILKEMAVEVDDICECLETSEFPVECL